MTESQLKLPVELRRLAIVPARGGSKRIPNKNIRDFCGQPMIAHILETARRFGHFERIHVSTDDARIGRVAADLGFPPDFMRPADLSDDHTPLMPVLKFVTETYRSKGHHFDQIWLLMACSPLIEVSDLVAILALFESYNRRAPVLCVARYGSPIERALKLDLDGFLQPVHPENMPKRTQDFSPSFFDAGVCGVFPPELVLSADGKVTKYLGYELSKLKAVDIDNQEDWEFAEAAFKHQHRAAR
jgi:N-acylneuraminate cytidylyltransferase